MSGRTRDDGVRAPILEFTDDTRLRSLSRQVELGQRRLADFGPIATSASSLHEAVGRLPSNGGVVWLAEGTWVFYEDFSITRDNIVLRAVSRLRTVFKRTGSSTDPMLTLGGSYNVVDGLSVDDAASGPAIKLTGGFSEVTNCRDTDAYTFVEVAANWCRVSNNHIRRCRHRAVDATGTFNHIMVVGNSIEASTDTDISFGDTVTKSAIVSNILDYDNGSISYKGSSDITESANAIDPSNVTTR